jgi:dTDP-N-acetylfucosamine:lipid II N-acetylfucosaminyltransferase
MNFHIMIDDKFIDRFINDSETVSIKNTNRYFIRGLKQNAIYVNHPKAEWFEDLWNNDFMKILSDITEQDKIFIHWYDLYIGRLILTIDKNILLYVCLWGGEFYEDPFLYHISWVYDKMTLKFVKKVHILPKKWAKNPIYLLKQLWGISNYKKKARKEFELKKLTVQRINYLLLHPNNFPESDLIKNIYEINELCVLPFTYNQNFDLSYKLGIKQNNNDALNIQIGNSATESNNHADCIEVLKKFDKENIKLIIPLSYGSVTYAEFVKKCSLKYFLNKFESIEKFMSRDDYVRKLNEVDVAVMYHNRSQAFGNMILLLSLGKKLYIKSNNPLWQLFKKIGINVFDANKIKDQTFEEFSTLLTISEVNNNIKIIELLFSENKSLEYLRNILN